ncbi:hypothetical protein NDU88_002031 [Pleurodeles waltl]|uniref:Uncharacterized protein n=1 Tax=Pleurodeles waltl TaxID=8319 RepID=A0AAV7RCV4_PLEWA|nr:hypothetical protein NDU88_002031 [Pleurodeles waltl]
MVAVDPGRARSGSLATITDVLLGPGRVSTQAGPYPLSGPNSLSVMEANSTSAMVAGDTSLAAFTEVILGLGDPDRVLAWFPILYYRMVVRAGQKSRPSPNSTAVMEDGDPGCEKHGSLSSITKVMLGPVRDPERP